MTEPDLWSRFKRARMVRVLALYLGAAWLILQVANELRSALGMPQWVSAATFLLLLVGLVIIAFTAWVQSHPATPARTATEQVPGSWELAAREIPAALAQGRLPHPTWARAIMGGVVAFLLLFGGAGFYVVVKDRGAVLLPQDAAAAVAPGIAVLPFSAMGADPAVWREGVVDLLSTNLDGVGGLRAISSRTVLARWHERVPEAATADLGMLLDVARAAGAAYALVGSAVRAESSLRLSATVYDAITGEEIGRAQAQDAPDSVFVLVDRLTVGIVGAVVAARAGELGPLPGLASLMTTSLPALRAFLRGAAHQRRADFPRAIAAYEEAVAADSTFALAALRLSEMYGWADTQHPGGVGYAELAGRWADRMPAREALLIRARLAFQQGSLDALDLTRRAVATYPDDAEAWYSHGDNLFHLGDAALADPVEAIRAFDRAIELDPSAAVYYRHAIQLAIARGDSTRARTLLDAYRGIAAASDIGTVILPLAYALAMGDDAAKAAAVAALDTLRPGAIGSAIMAFASPMSLDMHAPTLEARSTLIDRLNKRTDVPPFIAPSAVAEMFMAGRRDAALRTLRTDNRIPGPIRATQLYVMHLFGADPPVDVLDAGLLDPAVLDAELDEAQFGSIPYHLLSVAAYAADRGRWDVHENVMATVRRGEAEARESGDTTLADVHGALRVALDGYGAWRRGRAAEARAAFEAARHAAGQSAFGGALGPPVRAWLAMLHEAEGRPAEAIPYARTAADLPFGQLTLGGLYEQVGDLAAARRAYALALSAWTEADPDFPPARVAREGLARLAADR